ncbi:MAG TPA: hypothetical protein PKM88_08955, partial [bacterium]|nr:hypothetical protein [bacterium]
MELLHAIEHWKKWLVISALIVCLLSSAGFSANLNEWETLATYGYNSPMAGYGIAGSDNNSFIFSFFGANNSGQSGEGGVMRYNTVSNSWVQVNSINKAFLQRGAGVTWDGGNYIYGLAGRSNGNLSRLDVANAGDGGNNNLGYTNGLANMAGVDYGSPMVWNGGDYIFAVNSNGYIRNMRRYSISGNSWTDLGASPWTSSGSGVGLGMALDETNKNIFLVRGFRNTGNYTEFARYNISGNSWTTLANLPFTFGAFGGLAWDGGSYIYAVAGGGYDYSGSNTNAGNATNAFARYNIGNNVWENMANLPAPVGNNGSDVNDMNASFMSSSSLVRSGDYLYYLACNKAFFRYRHRIGGQNLQMTNVNAGPLRHASNTVYAGNFDLTDANESIIEMRVFKAGGTATTTEIPSLQLWSDVGSSVGVWDSGDSVINPAMSWNATLGCYAMSGATWTVSDPFTFVLTANLADTASLTDGHTFRAEIRGSQKTSGSSDSGVLFANSAGSSDDEWKPLQYFSNPDTLTVNTKIAATEMNLARGPTSTITSDANDSMIMAFTIPDDGGRAWTLNDVHVAHTGTLTAGTDYALSLWLDVDGDSSFEPAGHDAAGEHALEWSAGNSRWQDNGADLGVSVPIGGQRFFLALDANINGGNNETVKLTLPNSTTDSAFTLAPNINRMDTVAVSNTFTFLVVNHAPVNTSLTITALDSGGMVPDSTYTITTVHTDADAYANMKYCDLFINSSADTTTAGACAYLRYNEDDDHFYVRNDANTLWVDAGASGGASGGNSYVTLTGASASKGNDTITITWQLTTEFTWDDESCSAYMATMDVQNESDPLEDKVAVRIE